MKRTLPPAEKKPTLYAVLAVEPPRLTSSRGRLVLDGQPVEHPLTTRRLEKEIPVLLPPAILDVHEVSGAVRIGILANGNPISMTDPSGLWAGADDLAFTAGGAVIGAAGQGIADLVSWQWGGWAQIGRAAAAGAAGGEATLYGGPIVGGAVYAGTENILNQSSEMATTGDSFNYAELGGQTVVGGLTGVAAEYVPLPTIAGLNAGQGSFQAVTLQMVTKLENGTIQNISWNTAGQMFVSQTYNGLSDATLDGLNEGMQNLFGNSDGQSSLTGQTSVDWLGDPISSASSTGK